MSSGLNRNSIASQAWPMPPRALRSTTEIMPLSPATQRFQRRLALQTFTQSDTAARMEPCSVRGFDSPFERNDAPVKNTKCIAASPFGSVAVTGTANSRSSPLNGDTISSRCFITDTLPGIVISNPPDAVSPRTRAYQSARAPQARFCRPGHSPSATLERHSSTWRLSRLAALMLCISKKRIDTPSRTRSRRKLQVLMSPSRPVTPFLQGQSPPRSRSRAATRIEPILPCD